MRHTPLGEPNGPDEEEDDPVPDVEPEAPEVPDVEPEAPEVPPDEPPDVLVVQTTSESAPTATGNRRFNESTMW
ncbi:MAG: hypothetical protein EBS53_11005 [Bacteroidetes bacterium]|nr:hypothetical protein [Bacteroidota bacterium]